MYHRCDIAFLETIFTFSSRYLLLYYTHHCNKWDKSRCRIKTSKYFPWVIKNIWLYVCTYILEMQNIEWGPLGKVFVTLCYKSCLHTCICMARSITKLIERVSVLLNVVLIFVMALFLYCCCCCLFL